MNLYKYLKQHKDKQQKFCDDLIKDIPEILTYSRNNEKICYMSESISTTIPSFGVYTTSESSMSCYNIFNIFDRDFDEYPGWGVLDRRNLSYNQEKNLEPIVIDWINKYWCNILREQKLERILNESI